MMSMFLSYFETRIMGSQDYSEYPNVGTFVIPKEISAGEKHILFNGKIYRGGVISDKSKICANDYFLKNSKGASQILLEFIADRLKSSCVQANLFGFIEDGRKSISPKALTEITLEEVPNALKLANFGDGFGLAIRPSK